MSKTNQKLASFAITRTAAYYMCMNANKRKTNVKLGLIYFMKQIKSAEQYKEAIVKARHKDFRAVVSRLDEQLSSNIMKLGISSTNLGRIKSYKDSILYDNLDTKEVKKRYGIANSKSLYDHMDIDLLGFQIEMLTALNEKISTMIKLPKDKDGRYHDYTNYCMEMVEKEVYLFYGKFQIKYGDRPIDHILMWVN